MPVFIFGRTKRSYYFPFLVFPLSLLFLCLRVSQHVIVVSEVYVSPVSLCYVNVCWRACLQEGRNLVLRSARDLPQTCVCVCVVEILRPCVLTFEVAFVSPHFIIAIKMSTRKQNLEMNRVLEIPSGHKHADRTRTSLVFQNRSNRNQMSAE